MKTYTGTAESGISYTTISISTPMEDVPLPTKEEQEEEQIRNTANSIRSIEEGVVQIAWFVLVIALCQLVQCIHVVLK